MSRHSSGAFSAKDAFEDHNPESFGQESLRSSDSRRNSELSEDEHEGGNFKLDIQAFFKSSTVFNLLPRSGRVVVIDDRCSLMAAWTALALNDCAAAAVWSSAQNNFCGAFCVNDIVNIMCRHCTPASPPLSSSEAAPTDDPLVQCSALQSELLSNHMAVKGEPLDMSPADTIFNICSLMQARRCRFVPIIERDEEDGSCRAVQVLSYATIVRYLVYQQGKEIDLLVGTLRDLSIGTFTSVSTCSIDASLADAVAIMQQHSVSCLPLLDDKSALVDVLSENDLLLIPCSKIPITIRTPLRVLLQQRQSSSSSSAFQTCTPADTLLSVVRKFSSSRALRLVCVEQQGSSKIVGLVSLTDLFKYFIANER